MMTRCSGIAALGLLVAALGSGAPAGAVDGVIEVNQASVLAGSVDGDPGFPLKLSSPGSYRLTGDLAVGAGGDDGVRVTGSHVTLDLNGFRLHGGGRYGIYVEGGVRDLEVRNGTIADFGLGGVFVTGGESGARNTRWIGLRVTANGGTGMLIQSEGSLVRDCSVTDNGFLGMRVFPASLVVDNVVVRNAGLGLALVGASWGRNVVAQNNGGNANPQADLLGGATQIAPNICGLDTTCP